MGTKSMVDQNEIVIAHSRIILVGDSSNVYPSYAIIAPITNGDASKNSKNADGPCFPGLLREYIFPVAPTMWYTVNPPPKPIAAILIGPRIKYTDPIKNANIATSKIN